MQKKEQDGNGLHVSVDGVNVDDMICMYAGSVQIELEICGDECSDTCMDDMI
jgi:hypothetical protein